MQAEWKRLWSLPDEVVGAEGGSIDLYGTTENGSVVIQFWNVGAVRPDRVNRTFVLERGQAQELCASLEAFLTEVPP